jgi:hypothetical protein
MPRDIFALTPPTAPGGAWTESTLFGFDGGAWSEQTLYDFHGENDGSYPTQLILTRNGVIYGIANDYSEGGTLGGSIFAVQP